MRRFREIQDLLGDLPVSTVLLPDLKKIYLIGSTGTGKSSLIQHILGTTAIDFPTTSQRRTTLAPTEYVVHKSLPFKTTIILKQKKQILSELESIVVAALLKAIDLTKTDKDVFYELEQSADERFMLKHMLSASVLEAKANEITGKILPLIKKTAQSPDVDEESLITTPKITAKITQLVNDLLTCIETAFTNVCGQHYTLFGDTSLIIDGIEDKTEFIKKNQQWLRHSSASISPLVEYVRIEGNLLADCFDERIFSKKGFFDVMFDNQCGFIMIDGEGIGHSLDEKRDALSARHLDYFNYCHGVVLVADAQDPFTAGGQSVIEGMHLSGYQDKLKIVFTKTDMPENENVDDHIRRNINNLTQALKKADINFNYDHKHYLTLPHLNKPKLNGTSKKHLEDLLCSIEITKKREFIGLEYDYSQFFLDFDSQKLLAGLRQYINEQPWQTIRALTKDEHNEKSFECLRILCDKIAKFILQKVQVFLKRDDEILTTISDAQNNIKQQFSYELFWYSIIKLLNCDKSLWQTASQMAGRGADQKRKDYIVEHILAPFFPTPDQAIVFKKFRSEFKQMLIEAGAKEIESAIKTAITKVSIKNLFGCKNFEWSLGENVNILIGKNGSGKSTILKLIDACIKNDSAVLEYYGNPTVELTLLKTYEDSDLDTNTRISKIISGRPVNNINVVLVDTFDTKAAAPDEQQTNLDGQLKTLSDLFGKYQRSLNQTIINQTDMLSAQSKEIVSKIADASTEELLQFQQLSVKINEITDSHNKPLADFKKLIDEYFCDTAKKVIIDDVIEPLLIQSTDNNTVTLFEIAHLSSGEKQLLIIFLTVLLQKDQSFILLMDEPETSLHVQWQSTFIDKIRQINPNIQIIAATHNPLILLNRETDEIGTIELGNDVVQTAATGTKYLDISSILLDYFGLSSLIGTDMQRDVHDLTQLKLKQQLNKGKLTINEQRKLDKLAQRLDNNLAGDIIYNRQYFIFLKFLNQHKDIDFERFEQINDEGMHQLLSDFGDYFND
jgi:predicted ATP-binding protein involved in virulence/GTP-binding protein EngB required for normal cell division